MRARVRSIVFALFAAVLTACNAHDTPTHPEEACAISCASKATRCTQDECARGCNLTLDRIIEREEDRVISCVARASGACNDATWSTCATDIGPHVDGGPPPPPPAPDDW
jgi:hypothetical protein